MTVEPDEELERAWVEWWFGSPPAETTEEALLGLATLQDILAAHGFAIVRRFRTADT